MHYPILKNKHNKREIPRVLSIQPRFWCNNGQSRWYAFSHDEADVIAIVYMLQSAEFGYNVIM